MQALEKQPCRGPYRPALILHGGAGALTRQNVPPKVYEKYHASLLKFLTSTRNALDSGASALDAACQAVSMFEDDPIFNCGRGAVFTREGTIEMEASVMVASIDPSASLEGHIKRTAAVSLVRNTRHPILLAKEVLLQADADDGLGGASTMHCHLSGRDVEEWGWTQKGLEYKDFKWFWTKERWDQHRKGLERGQSLMQQAMNTNTQAYHDPGFPSQGTVGAVCMDSWGRLCVATSTGGLTNKASGRIGDTPTAGAGFWAEGWDLVNSSDPPPGEKATDFLSDLAERIMKDLYHCFPLDIMKTNEHPKATPCFYRYENDAGSTLLNKFQDIAGQPCLEPKIRRRAVAMSGTGNGDSFLRTDAVRSAAALCRYTSPSLSLAQAVTQIAGSNGELQRSAGNRWRRTGEGEGGIIGIEVYFTPNQSLTVETVYDFNCGGMWRAWYATDPESGKDVPQIMVFREEY